MAETPANKPDFRNGFLIRDLRDQYPYGAVLAMLIETIGNSIDAHANEIRIEIDRNHWDVSC